jgi:hypothetical protein
VGLDKLGKKIDYTILTYEMLNNFCCNEQLLLVFKPLWVHPPTTTKYLISNAI